MISKKDTSETQKTKSYSKIKFILVAITVVGISTTFAILFQAGDAETFEDDGIDKAVIIDQLHDEFPNKIFHDRAVNYLESAGYVVDIFTTKDITVDFYKKLPKMNYDLVLIRSHGTSDKIDNDVVLFTGERYTEDNYISEQLFGHVKRATPLLEIAYSSSDSISEWVIVNDTYRYQKTSVAQQETATNEFFAITPKLVNELMDGKFQDTIFVLGGCNTMSNPSLSNSLINRGASTVLGWDDTVGNIDNDLAMLFFLSAYLEQKMDIDETVNEINNRMVYEEMAYPANFILHKNI